MNPRLRGRDVRGVLVVASVAFIAVARAPSTPATITVDVNIPAFRLDVYEDSSRRATYQVSVGMKDYPTPVGEYGIHTIEWNPWWVPPRRDWVTDTQPVPPGPRNPMRRVKLRFLPLYYLHGTPDSASVGKPLSHGCVRMRERDAVALALAILRADSTAIGTDVTGAAPDTTTRKISLRTPVAVRLRYDVVELRDDTLWLNPDIYGREGRAPRAAIMAALDTAGIDTLRIPAAALAPLLRAGLNTPRPLALRTLPRARD